MQVPFPVELQSIQATAAYQRDHPQRDLHQDLLTAHEYVGLLRCAGIGSSRCCLAHSSRAFLGALPCVMLNLHGHRGIRLLAVASQDFDTPSHLPLEEHFLPENPIPQVHASASAQ